MNNIMKNLHSSVNYRAISASVDITVRQLNLSFNDDITEFWFDGNPLLTCFLTALSAAFPEGERQFIHSVRNYQNQITDPLLLKQVRAFIGQEAHHGKEHDSLNNMMQRKGYPMQRIDARFRKMNHMMQSHFSAAHQLASTVCMEHLTAILADYFISTAPQDLALFDPQLRKLWAWHAIEETEHKAVAFEVYQTLVQRPYFLRLVMLETTFFFVLVSSRGTLELLKASGQKANVQSWRRGLSFLFGGQGLVAKVSRPYLDFFRPGFHPWQHDNRERLVQLKREYLGE